MKKLENSFKQVKDQEARSKDAKGETFFGNKENVR